MKRPKKIKLRKYRTPFASAAARSSLLTGTALSTIAAICPTITAAVNASFERWKVNNSVEYIGNGMTDADRKARKREMHGVLYGRNA
jgi:hypothetical protein